MNDARSSASNFASEVLFESKRSCSTFFASSVSSPSSARIAICARFFASEANG